MRAFPDDSFAVWPGAGDPLGGVLADQEAVARAPHILAPGGRVPAFNKNLRLGNRLKLQSAY